MQRRTSDTSTPTDTASTTSSPASDDPDRPTLKRHSAEDAKRAHDTNSVVGTGALNADPDRPNMHRGKPTSAMTDSDLPKLSRLPQNLHQMVAVSDAANRDPHPFTLEWDDELLGFFTVPLVMGGLKDSVGLRPGFIILGMGMVVLAMALPRLQRWADVKTGRVATTPAAA